MGNIISCIDNKNKLYFYNIESSTYQQYDNLLSSCTVMEWGYKSDNIINIGLKNNSIRSMNINTKSWNDIQILKYEKYIFYLIKCILIFLLQLIFFL